MFGGCRGIVLAGNEVFREEVERLERAGVMYAVAEHRIQAAQVAISRVSGQPAAATLGAVHALLIPLAYEHKLDCDRSDCRPCQGIEEILTVTTAGLRALADEAEAEAGRSSWWRRLGKRIVR